MTPATQESTLWARQARGRLLSDLSPAHCQILIPVHCLSYEDAATKCGCSVRTAKSRLNRVMVTLATLV